MNDSFYLVLILSFVYLSAQFFGLYVTGHYTTTELPYGLEPPKVEEGTSPIMFISVIIFTTIIIIILMKYKLTLIWKVWFVAVLTICMAVSLNSIFTGIFVGITAFILAVLRLKEQDIYLHNFTEILVYGGLVSLFAPMFNLSTITILLIAICIYDVISVWITKHIVKLAVAQSKAGIFPGIIIAYKNQRAILGGGDIGFPLLFAAIVARDLNMVHSYIAVFGALLGLIILFIISRLSKKPRFYPAMPFITLGIALLFPLGYLL